MFFELRLETVVGTEDGVFDAGAEVGDGGGVAAGETTSENGYGVMAALLGELNDGGVGVGVPNFVGFVPSPADLVIDFGMFGKARG